MFNFFPSVSQALHHDMLENLLSWILKVTFSWRPVGSKSPGEMYLSGRVQERLLTPCSLSQLQKHPVCASIVPAAVQREASERVRIRVVRECGRFCSGPLHRAAPDLQPADDGVAVVGGDHLHHGGTSHSRHSAARHLPGCHHCKGLVSNSYLLNTCSIGVKTCIIL